MRHKILGMILAFGFIFLAGQSQAQKFEELTLEEIKDNKSSSKPLYEDAFWSIYKSVECKRSVSHDHDMNNENQKWCHSSTFSLVHWINKFDKKFDFASWNNFKKGILAKDTGDVQIENEAIQKQLISTAFYIKFRVGHGILISTFDNEFKFQEQVKNKTLTLPQKEDLDDWLTVNIYEKLYNSNNQVDSNENCTIF